MKINVRENLVTCPDLNMSIHHMECNDECQFFYGCVVLDGQFVINCHYNLVKQGKEDLVHTDA